MKKTIVATALIISASVAQAEVPFNPSNIEHKADNICVGALSLVRDALFNDVQVSDGIVYLREVENTQDLVAFRNKVTDVSNALVLRYEYSKFFNDSYRSYKKQLSMISPEKFETIFNECMKRG